jgi:hypothetical protein
MSVDRVSRFVVVWASGPRDEALADEIVTATNDRTTASEAITYVSDGWEAYETAVKRAYWEREVYTQNPSWAILKPVDTMRLTQAIKHWGPKGTPRRLARVEVRDHRRAGRSPLRRPSRAAQRGVARPLGLSHPQDPRVRQGDRHVGCALQSGTVRA